VNYRAFNNYMNEIVNATDAQHNHLDEKAEITFTNNGKWALHKLEKMFKDKDRNIRRFLNRKPCVFTSDKMGKKIEINIGNDREALYYFLVFCYRINNKQEIEVAKLCEQNNRYERYREKKIMDDVSYMEQTDRLKARLTQLRSRRLKLLSENENEQMIEQLKMLKEIIQDYPKAIVEFDETLFTSIVSKIKVCHDGTLIFELKGQLSLKERIEVSRKCA